MTQIYLVRHGYTGVPELEQTAEVGLIDVGREQITQIAERINREASFLHLVYTSTIKRAVESAEIIARVCNSQVMEDPRLDEIDYAANIQALKRLAYDTPQAEKSRHILQQAQERAVSLLHDIAKKHRNEVIVLATHGNIIRGIIAEAIDASLETISRLRISNGSLSILEYNADEDYFVLSLFNDTSHLG